MFTHDPRNLKTGSGNINCLSRGVRCYQYVDLLDKYTIIIFYMKWYKQINTHNIYIFVELDPWNDLTHSIFCINSKL